MRRADFEHLIRAAADVSRDSEIVVIGSQAILGSFPDAPEDMVFSLEADVYPRNAPEKAVEIDGSLGDGSAFHRQFGYYAHAVGPETAKAPDGWHSRLVAVEVPLRAGSSQGRIVAYCMEPHDLVLAKCVANRPRDWEFAAAALRAKLVSLSELEARIHELPIDCEWQTSLRKMLRATAASLRS